MPAYRGSNDCVTRHASAVVVSGGVAAGSALGEPWYVRTLRLPCAGRRCSSSTVVCGHFLSRPGTYLPRQTCVVLACGGATAPAAGCWWLLQARRPCSALCAPVCPCVPCVAYRPVCEE